MAADDPIAPVMRCLLTFRLYIPMRPVITMLTAENIQMVYKQWRIWGISKVEIVHDLAYNFARSTEKTSHQANISSENSSKVKTLSCWDTNNKFSQYIQLDNI